MFCLCQLKRTAQETALNIWIPRRGGSAYGVTLARLWCVRKVCWGPTSLADADSLNWEVAWQPRQVNVFPLQTNTMKYDWVTVAFRQRTWSAERRELICLNIFGGFISKSSAKKSNYMGLNWSLYLRSQSNYCNITHLVYAHQCTH